jgi:histone-lysine N-methyltransferase SETMAR
MNSDQKINGARHLSNFWIFFVWRDPNDFLLRLVTMDRIWLYKYDPETKQQSMEWQNSRSPSSQNFRVQNSTGKFLASIFLNQDSILLIDYLPKGQTINTDYYSSLLVQLKVIFKKKRLGNFTKVALFLQDNALDHRALETQKKLAYLGFQCLGHPPYSPDLVPSDYHLFHELKKTKVRHFLYDTEVIAAAETWLDGQQSEFL